MIGSDPVATVVFDEGQGDMAVAAEGAGQEGVDSHFSVSIQLDGTQMKSFYKGSSEFGSL